MPHAMIDFSPGTHVDTSLKAGQTGAFDSKCQENMVYFLDGISVVYAKICVCKEVVLRVIKIFFFKKMGHFSAQPH